MRLEEGLLLMEAYFIVLQSPGNKEARAPDDVTPDDVTPAPATPTPVLPESMELVSDAAPAPPSKE